MKDDSKRKALDLAVAQIEKQFGEGSIMTLGKSSATREINVIKTGAITLDIALGIGGIPRGRIVEIYGPESSGKSTLATHIVANAQKNGGLAAYIDAEHAFDPSYASKIGVNLDELLISQPDCGEDALNIAETLARSNAVDVIVIDSVAALVPKNGAGRGDWRLIHGTASPHDVPSPAKTHSFSLQKQYHRRFHQPDPRKDRRDVWQPGNDHRRPRSQILLLNTPRYPPIAGIKGNDNTDVGTASKSKS